MIVRAGWESGCNEIRIKEDCKKTLMMYAMSEGHVTFTEERGAIIDRGEKWAGRTRIKGMSYDVLRRNSIL